MHNTTTAFCLGGSARAKYAHIIAALFLLALIGSGCGITTYTVKLYPITPETQSVKTGHGENILVAMAADNRGADKNMLHANAYMLSPCLNDDGDNFGDIGYFVQGLHPLRQITIFEQGQDLPKTVSDAVVDTLKSYGYNASLLDARDTGKTDGPVTKVLYPSVERLNYTGRRYAFGSLQHYGTAVLGFSIKQPGDDRVLWSGSVVNRSNVGSVIITLGDPENVINQTLQGAIKGFGEQTGTAGFRNALVYDKSARMVNEGKP